MKRESVSAAVAGVARGVRLLAPAAAVAALAAAPSISAGLAAQQGAIVYEWSRQYDFEVPDRFEAMAGDGETGAVVLRFAPSASLMTPAPREERRPGWAGDRIAARIKVMKSRSTSRRDQEILRSAWVSYSEDRLVETREFMGRTFLIDGAPPQYAWRMTGEQAEHLGRMVIKATAETDGAPIEAWFTPEIPVPGGPASYGGLPGMILVLSLDGGRTQYFATEIALEEAAPESMRAPDDGQQVSREEYEAIVEEKLDELRRLYGRPGDGSK